jgi:hypothetical protein
VPPLNLTARRPDHYFLRSQPHFGIGLGLLEEFAPSALQKMRLSMGIIAHAFYLLADLKGTVRSNSRAPCYLFIDPSIQPDSIVPIQFSNLVFDLFGIHKKSDRSAQNYSIYREILDPWLLKVLHFSGLRLPVEESHLAAAGK